MTTTDLDRLRLEGRRSTGVWGAATGAGVLTIVLAYFLYAYLYLSVSSDAWPPGSTPEPPLLRPAALLATLAVAAIVTLRTARVGADEHRGSSAAVALAAVAAIGAVTIVFGFALVGDLALRPRDQAYGAIVTTVHAVQGAATAAGVAIASLTAFEAHRLGSRHPWVAAARVVTSIWWCTVVVGWVAVFGVLYVWPQLS